MCAEAIFWSSMPVACGIANAANAMSVTDFRISPLCRARHGARADRELGFSLLEVAIAVVVLAIGLLGLAALQVAGLKANDSSGMRTRAVIAASSAIDRARADPAGIFASGKLSVAVDGSLCAKAASAGFEKTAVGRWQSAFCDFHLPPPKTDNAAQMDCSGKGCGAGNCEVLIRWDDSRGERSSSTSPRAGDMQFRVCTRLTLP